jgi:SAM-dependent methyltransferase
MPVSKGRQLDDFWDGTAAGYDRWYGSPQGAMYDFLEKRAAAWGLRGGLPPSSATLAPRVAAAGQGRAGRRLLEVGCGTGRWSVWLAAQGYEVTGLDRSPGMLEVARRRSAGSDGGAAHINWLEGDACSLPVADGSYDVALSAATLDYLGDGPDGRGLAERAVAEMSRAVGIGGRLVVGVFNRLAPLNVERAREGGPPWDGARMFSVDELSELLSTVGKEHGVRPAAWLPEDDRLLPTAPAIDYQHWQQGRDDGLMLFGWAVVDRRH